VAGALMPRGRFRRPCWPGNRLLLAIELLQAHAHAFAFNLIAGRDSRTGGG